MKWVLVSGDSQGAFQLMPPWLTDRVEDRTLGEGRDLRVESSVGQLLFTSYRHQCGTTAPLQSRLLSSSPTHNSHTHTQSVTKWNKHLTPPTLWLPACWLTGWAEHPVILPQAAAKGRPDTPRTQFACRHRGRSTADRSNLFLGDIRLNLNLFSLPCFCAWA